VLSRREARRNLFKGFLGEGRDVRTASLSVSLSERQTSMPADFTRRVHGGERHRGLDAAWVRRHRGAFSAAVRPLRPGERTSAWRDGGARALLWSATGPVPLRPARLRPLICPQPATMWAAALAC
ncbi:hypothetical protein TraAM80_03280, partial [Trypanosoma rangeli]